MPFLRALREHDQWAVAVLLHTPAPELHDATPVQWEREHRKAAASDTALADFAAAVAREWRRGAA